MNKTKQDKGFTLVELLIVIVILGILATVTVFAVRGITQDAEQNACDTEQDVIETAIEAFNADQREDATTVTDLTDTYLKDSLAFNNAYNSVMPPLPAAQVAVVTQVDAAGNPSGNPVNGANVAGRWDITFSNVDGPSITGVNECAP